MVKARRQWQDRFINALRVMGNVWRAALSANVSRATPYYELHRNPEFAQAWKDAEEESADRIEAEMWRRGVEGIEKPVTIAGEREIVREYDTPLLMMLAKARRPARFRENSNVTIANPDGSKLEMDCRQQAVNLFTNNPEAAAHMIALANLACPAEGETKMTDANPQNDCQGSPIEAEVVPEARQKRKYTRKASKQPKPAKARQTPGNGGSGDGPSGPQGPEILPIVDNSAPAVTDDLEIPDATPDIDPKATPAEGTPEPEATTEELSPLMKQMLGL